MSNENTILLVEDDTFLIDILVQKFKSDGYNVVHAGDGETALKKVHENDPDLIFLDIILPGMNGFEVLKKLKDDDTIGSIPVAFLSNLGQKEDIEKGKRLGAVDFIVKANHSLDEIVDKAGEILASSSEGSTGSSKESQQEEPEENHSEKPADEPDTDLENELSPDNNDTASSAEPNQQPAGNGSKSAAADSVPEAPSSE